jgi:dienelactone hydrolase
MSQHDGLMARVSPWTPMHTGFDPDASEDAWGRVLAFFGEHLAPRAG